MSTGFTLQQKAIIVGRDHERCRRCGSPRPSDVHHRTPRGLGGAPSANRIAAGVLLCRACHTQIESRREQATATGWLVPRGTDPSKVPVVDVFGNVIFLDDKGRAIFEDHARVEVTPWL